MDALLGNTRIVAYMCHVHHTPISCTHACMQRAKLKLTVCVHVHNCVSCRAHVVHVSVYVCACIYTQHLTVSCCVYFVRACGTLTSTVTAVAPIQRAQHNTRHEAPRTCPEPQHNKNCRAREAQRTTLHKVAQRHDAQRCA